MSRRALASARQVAAQAPWPRWMVWGGWCAIAHPSNSPPSTPAHASPYGAHAPRPVHPRYSTHYVLHFESGHYMIAGGATEFQLVAATPATSYAGARLPRGGGNQSLVVGVAYPADQVRENVPSLSAERSLSDGAFGRAHKDTPAGLAKRERLRYHHRLEAAAMCIQRRYRGRYDANTRRLRARAREGRGRCEAEPPRPSPPSSAGTRR